MHGRVVPLAEYLKVDKPEEQIEIIKKYTVNGCPVSFTEKPEEALQFMRNFIKNLLSAFLQAGIFNKNFSEQNIINKIDVKFDEHDKSGINFYYRY